MTDVTNASRTLMMDLRSLSWDSATAETIGVPQSMLPEIHSSSEVYGEVKSGPLAGIPIAGDLGDQQAATFGQTCFAVGEAKNTYGTGNFMLINTGDELVHSKSGLLTTVCYRVGDQKPVYALEGSIAITGALVQWMRDNLKMIKAAPEVEELAATVDDNGGLYIVPAFSGLYAPYWKSDARGVFAGLTRYVNAGHIARATLEATAYQSAEIVEAMRSDSGVELDSLKVDGGMVGKRNADAVPGRHPRSAGDPARGSGDDRARRRLRGRLGDGFLGQPGGPARELGRGQALGTADGRRGPQAEHAHMEEGGDPDLRLGRVTVFRLMRWGRLAGSPPPGGGGSLARPHRPDGRLTGMVTLTTEVLVIGGGATGAGVAWDASLRGLDVILVDRLDLAEGTSGRFHGLLHSGGRYVVKDAPAARECIAENRILRRVAADCIEDTGGMFVTTPWDDPAYADRFAAACGQTGVDCEEIPVAQALREEPRLNPKISRAFRVPDANIDIWKTVWAMAHGAEQRGARILPYHEVTAIRRDGDRVTGAIVRDARAGGELEIEARVTVNAAGAWAGQIAALAGIEGVRVLPGRGIMIAMNHRLVNTVINRCQLPADGDILVPIRTVSVIGTTDEHTEDPDDHTVEQPEVDRMLDDGEKLVPGLPQGARAARLDRRAAAVRGRQGRGHRDPRRDPRARAARPSRARRRRRLRDDHRRQGHDLPPDGRGDRRRGLRHPRPEHSLHDGDAAAAGFRARRELPAGRASRAQGGTPARPADDLRVRARAAREARARAHGDRLDQPR